MRAFKKVGLVLIGDLHPMSHVIEKLLRVTVVSQSERQRNKLKQLLSKSLFESIDETTLIDLCAGRYKIISDVLLVDLCDADDDVLDSLDDLFEKTNIPIVFTEGLTTSKSLIDKIRLTSTELSENEFPQDKEDVSKAVEAIQQDASEEILANKNSKSQGTKKIQRKSKSVTYKFSKQPRIIIVSKSESTRCMVKRLFQQQGLKNVVDKTFSKSLIREIDTTIDLYVFDENKVGLNEFSVFMELYEQARTRVFSFDCTEIPVNLDKQHRWAKRLIKNIFIYQAQVKDDPYPVLSQVV